MTSFARVARTALRYRVTVLMSVLCSAGIAVLWAANFSVFMPVVDGIMHGKAIPALIEERIAQATQRIEAFDDQIANLQAKREQAQGESVRRYERKLESVRNQRTSSQWWLNTYRRLLPYAQQWLPMTPFGTLVAICVLLIISTLLKSVLRVINSVLVAKLGHLTTLSMRKEFYRRTLKLDLSTFREASQGDLMNRFTTDVESIGQGIKTLFGMAIREPLKMLACLVGAMLISWRLLLISIVCAPAAVYLFRWLAKSLKRANRRALQELSSVYDHLEETFDGIKVVKAFTMESHERSRFHRVSRQYYRRSMKIALYDSLANPVAEVVGLLVIVGMVTAGGYLVLNEQTQLFGIRVSYEPLTHGMLTAFYAMLAGFIEPVQRLSTVFNYLQRAAVASDRVYELLDRESKIRIPASPIGVPAELGDISFDQVTFAYTPEEIVLRNVSMRFKAGETIAIVGPNGCGKSTLMNLVPRFHDPVDGTVSIGGIDLRQVRPAELRKRIGLVTQETLLFDDTVANNIRYGTPEANMQQVIAAAKQAHAHRFITESLTDGYDTMCGMGGNRLSGGQRQRLALARAILRDPEILILDEATSQIDIESERLIHEVLEHFTKGRTVFMITHRPSTLALADRIVVMEAGRVADIGSFAELSERCELFCRLARLEVRVSA